MTDEPRHLLPRDHQRGTGRTTRMLTRALGPGTPVVVVAADKRQVENLSKTLAEMASSTRPPERVEFVTVDDADGYGNLDLRGTALRPVLWDHYAVDIWEQREHARIRRAAAALRSVT